MPDKHLLILGGTGEARELARRVSLMIGKRVRVTTSLAGRRATTPNLAGEVHTVDVADQARDPSVGAGGFGLHREQAGVAFRGEDDDMLRDMSLTHVCTGSDGLAFQKIVLNHK